MQALTYVADPPQLGYRNQIILSVGQNNIRRNPLYKLGDKDVVAIGMWLTPGLGARVGPLRPRSHDKQYYADTGHGYHSVKYNLEVDGSRGLLVAASTEAAIHRCLQMGNTYWAQEVGNNRNISSTCIMAYVVRKHIVVQPGAQRRVAMPSSMCTPQQAAAPSAPGAAGNPAPGTGG